MPTAFTIAAADDMEDEDLHSKNASVLAQIAREAVCCNGCAAQLLIQAVAALVYQPGFHVSSLELSTYFLETVARAEAERKPEFMQ